MKQYSLVFEKNMYQQSDWNIFKELFPKWQERYLAKKNQQVLELLTETGKTHTEKFMNAKAKLNSEAKILDKCFQHHTRRNLHYSLSEMYRHNFIDEEDLVRFSDRIRNYVITTARNISE